MDSIPSFNPGTSEIQSPLIAGLSEAISKLSESAILFAGILTDEPLSEVYIGASDRYRIYQVADGKRIWNNDITVKIDGVVTTPLEGHFTIDYVGGSITFDSGYTKSSTTTITVSGTYLYETYSRAAEDPIGTIKWSADTDFATSNTDYLKCDGSGIETEDYPTLAEQLKTSYYLESASTLVGAAIKSITVGKVDGNDVILALTNSNSILYKSTDGVTFTIVTTTGLGSGLQDITYGDGKFVAVGGSGGVYYSTDTENWTQATAVVSTRLNKVVYDGTRFIAAGRSVITSSDGVIWTLNSSFTETTTNDQVQHIAFNNKAGFSSYVMMNEASGTSVAIFTTNDPTGAWNKYNGNSSMGDSHNLVEFTAGNGSTIYNCFLIITETDLYRVRIKNDGTARETDSYAFETFVEGLGGTIVRISDGNNSKESFIIINNTSQYYLFLPKNHYEEESDISNLNSFMNNELVKRVSNNGLDENDEWYISTFAGKFNDRDIILLGGTNRALIVSPYYKVSLPYLQNGDLWGYIKAN